MRYFRQRFSPKEMELLSTVKGILKTFDDMLPLTLRQIFYQVVSLPNPPLSNSKSSYQKLSKLLTKARLGGEIDFEYIEDRTRHTRNTPLDLETLLYNYYPDAWIHQSTYVEVFVEKEALGSFFVRTLRQYYVPVTATKGFNSLSSVMEIAERLHDQEKKIRYAYLFTDFDPSGESISKDFEFRIKKCLLMLGEDPTYYDEEAKAIGIPNLSIQKVALTKEQVDEYNLPPMFAKPQDPRAKEFIQEYGDKSVVELDALPPQILKEIIMETVIDDLDMVEVSKAQELEGRMKTEGLKGLQSIEAEIIEGDQK
jgi:5S rRNA maturation endonuclease (ribonuclease M5)